MATLSHTAVTFFTRHRATDNMRIFQTEVLCPESTDEKNGGTDWILCKGENGRKKRKREKERKQQHDFGFRTSGLSSFVYRCTVSQFNRKYKKAKPQTSLQVMRVMRLTAPSARDSKLFACAFCGSSKSFSNSLKCLGLNLKKSRAPHKNYILATMQTQNHTLPVRNRVGRAGPRLFGPARIRAVRDGPHFW